MFRWMAALDTATISPCPCVKAWCRSMPSPGRNRKLDGWRSLAAREPVPGSTAGPSWSVGSGANAWADTPWIHPPALAAAGNAALDKLADKLSSTPDARKRYEYVLWLAKKLPPMDEELQTEARKVQGCVSQVFVDARLEDGRCTGKALQMPSSPRTAGPADSRPGRADPRRSDGCRSRLHRRHRPTGKPHPFPGQWLPQHPAHEQSQASQLNANTGTTAE